MKMLESQETLGPAFKAVKPRVIRLSQTELVETSFVRETQLPLVMRPVAESVNLLDWALSNRSLIEAQLLRYGAILFRDFKVGGLAQFEQVIRAISKELVEYGERSSPRTRIGNGVYTSTDHPADQYILLHNEQSYTLNWPMKICFYCVQPAQQQGHTPIADTRRILRRLDPAILEKFARHGVMYVRNYGHGLGLSWQEAFQTQDKFMVEQHCRNAFMEFEWRDRDHLRTWQTRPAIRRHPQTGESVWFNHAAFFHLSSLESSTRKTILALVDEQDVPFNTFYGDGTPIEPSVLEEIREAYRQETVSFPWQEEDILVLDNMLTSHGREPFIGPRKIAVAMADAFAGDKDE